MNKETTSYEDILETKPFFVITPKGTSMLPLLRQGIDTIKVIKPTSPFKKYDVILFKRKDGSYVLHRIIKVKKNCLYLCGDNQVIKEKVMYDQVIGLMEGYFREEEYISCSDKSYLKYSKRRVASRPFRFIRYFLSRIYHKIFKKDKKK